MVSWQKDNEQSQRHTLEVKVITETKADSDSDADAAIELSKIIFQLVPSCRITKTTTIFVLKNLNSIDVIKLETIII